MTIFKPQFTKAEIANLQIAYQQAIYQVYDRDCTIQLQIGKSNSQLNSLLQKYNTSTWALITAANPYSQCLSEAENQQRHELITEYLKYFNFTTIDAVGKDEAGAWTPEQSLFILNINLCDAIAIGREFQQNAIVYGKSNKAPQLIWL